MSADAPTFDTLQADAQARERRRLDKRLSIFGPVLFGLLVVALITATAFSWAGLVPLEKGASASGRLIVESQAKDLQSRAGGRVARVFVREGDVVASSQLLVRMDTQPLERQFEAAIGQLDAAERQLGLLGEEVAAYRQLLERKLTQRSRVLGLERQEAELEKEIHRLQAMIANFEDEIAQADIRAPATGQVLQLAVNAPGEVVAPGATVLQFVPGGERLVVEARLRPSDVADVTSGMMARVWLSAFSRRDVAPLNAQVAFVSPDAVQDGPNQAPYYLVRLILTDPEKVPGGVSALRAGMTADILLVTGETTILEQFLEPFMRSISRATQS